MTRSLLALFVCSGVALAQPVPKVTSVAPPPSNALWVGNSFFYRHDGLHGLVSELLDAADPKNTYGATLIAKDGAALRWHDVDAYLRPNRQQGFYFKEGNTLVFGQPRPFDAVIMHDCIQCPIHPRLKDAFHATARKNADIVRRHGARPILFMTWPLADHPETTSQLAEEYTRAGNESGALVIPVGLAFAAAQARDPGVVLYEPDKRHPSMAGSYLAACTVLAAVYGKSPVGNGFTAGLAANTAAFLQSVAADTVTRYFGRRAEGH